MYTKKMKDADRESHRKQLLELLPPGSRVYTSIAHVSRSGMQREVKVYAVEDGQIREITGLVASVASYRRGRHWGVVVGGCGFDAGFDVVYHLAYELYRDGFGCVGEHCPSNDHSNGDRDYTPHPPTRTPCPKDADPAECKRMHCHWHRDGGYALRHDSL